MKKLMAILAVVGLMATAGTTMAADTANLTVTATVLDACSVEVDQDISFGELDPINDVASSTNASSNGNAGLITVTCTKGTAYSLETITTSPTMTLDGGGTNPIAYTPTIPTGDYTGDMSGAQYTIDATVQKSAYENVPAGAYRGQLNITVSY